jgi:hypothetical protein
MRPAPNTKEKEGELNTKILIFYNTKGKQTIGIIISRKKEPDILNITPFWIFLYLISQRSDIFFFVFLDWKHIKSFGFHVFNLKFENDRLFTSPKFR